MQRFHRLATEPRGPSGGNPGSTTFRKGGSEAASSFYALNKRSRVYSARAWVVPQGKAGGISRDVLQPIAARSTEEFLTRSHFSSAPGPSEGRRGLCGRCGEVCDGGCCSPAAGYLPPQQGEPRGAGAGKARSSTALDVDHYPYSHPPRERETVSSWGHGVQYSHIPERPSSLPAHREGERAPGTAWGWCFTSWPPPAARKGSLSPALALPAHAGQARPWSKRSDSDPGAVPSWLAGHAIFCLKRKRFTQGKTSKGLSPSHPHTNRFV